MAQQWQKQLGVNAIVSILSKYIHSSEHIRDKFPNRPADHRLENCKVTGRDNRKVCTQDQDIILVKHEDLKTDNGNYIEIYSVARWCNITTACSDANAFEVVEQAEWNSENVVKNSDANATPQVLLDIKQHGQIIAKDITNLQEIGVAIDNDNAPAPENIPGGVATGDGVLRSWEHDGICFRRQVGGEKIKQR